MLLTSTAEVLEGGPVGNHHVISPRLCSTAEVTSVSFAIRGNQPIREERQTENCTSGMQALGLTELGEGAKKSSWISASSKWLPWNPVTRRRRSSAPARPAPPRSAPPSTPSLPRGVGGGEGCEVSQRSVCAVGSGARGGGFITTSTRPLGFYLGEGG